jgi:AcrR family transcriptional regulator
MSLNYTKQYRGTIFMSKKTDLRILRSKHSIREAFIQLLNEKGYEAITIQDIADKAMINRNTFYLHYQNKPDLLNTCIDELLEEMKNALALCPSSKSPVNVSKLEQVMQTILEHIIDNISFYKAMLVEENRIHVFQTKMENIIKSRINDGIEHTQLEISKEFLLQYIASAFMGVVVWWLKNDLIYSPREIATQFVKILTQGHLKAAGIAIDK